MKYLLAMFLVFGMLACSSGKTKIVETHTVKTVTVKDPGAVEYVWEPPIVDVVDVPPGLDPEGIYYRPHHQEVVEIRKGRWRYKEAQDIQRSKKKIVEIEDE